LRQDEQDEQDKESILSILFILSKTLLAISSNPARCHFLYNLPRATRHRHNLHAAVAQRESMSLTSEAGAENYCSSS
jgi:hypothetical protein